MHACMCVCVVVVVSLCSYLCLRFPTSNVVIQLGKQLHVQYVRAKSYTSVG